MSARRHPRARLIGLVSLAALVPALFAAPSTPASVVTIGSPLTGGYFQSTFGQVGTVANTALPEPGAHLTSPVTGTIVRWRIKFGAGGPFRLRILTPGAGTAFTGGLSSGPQSPSGLGVETFATSLPIQVGQTIGLDNTSTSDTIGNSEFFTGTGSSTWKPSLALGETRSSFTSTGNELSFNADVFVPEPRIDSLTPGSGSILGGTQVTIFGHDLNGAGAVSFGSTPAAGFTVDSDSRITATSPPASAPGGVGITVTTPGGQTAAGPASTFTYTACVVPKLKGRKLKADRKKLKAAGCRLGKVRGRRAKGARVTKQSPRPGKVLAPGSGVNVKLG